MIPRMSRTSSIKQEKQRVAIGMSGGLDSSVVAALCVEQGYEVIGLTLHMFKEGSRCCSADDIERSRHVCDHLGIRHYVVNVVEDFQKTIIEPFIEGYARGITPSPCVWCNQHIKFGALHKRAVHIGCSYIATGHYVRVEKRNDGWHLYQARDSLKDQSYFLHRLSQEQLSRSLFPLEAWTKKEVAQYAEEKALPVSTSSKAESQDLCFVPETGHAPFIEQARPDLRKKGTIVDTSGKTLGTHSGFHHFTIGQRKGLNVATGSKMYVKRLENENNRVIIGPRKEVMDRECKIENIHWIMGSPASTQFTCETRIRYRHGAAPCHVTVLDDESIRIAFDEPQFAITPGQAAVMYKDAEVLGGGWIV
ncbi:MAG: tRNA 2-thiouridine(34) synthase MnmA [Kiritimatiellae bacterium]|nr:tRNA 2-thiouridine(34) synthase MnmA [Kiritimatiellia bacterium]